MNLRQRLARVRWARTWIRSDMKTVLFSDEKRFRMRNDGPSRCWRLCGDRFKPRHICGTTKYGAGSIMVWGCISYNGVVALRRVDGTLDSPGYVRMLTPLVRVLRGRGRSSITFQHDGAPPHTARATERFLRANGITLLPWVAQSPDANVIEHVWAKLQREMRGLSFTSPDLLWAEVQRRWAALPVAYIKSLYDSIPRRLQAIIDARGHPTRY